MNDKDYILMAPTSTYALGVEAIRESSAKGGSMQPLYIKQDGSRIVRPLTFAENLQARVEDYNTVHNPDGSVKTDGQRSYLFSRRMDSCTGVAYKAGTKKFKIVFESKNLIEIPPQFDGNFMQIDYDSIVTKEFDYNDAPINAEEDCRHWQDIGILGWLEAVEEDKALLSEYDKIMSVLLKKIHNDLIFDYCFLVHGNIDDWYPSDKEKDKLKWLGLDSIAYNSAVIGYADLTVRSFFIHVGEKQ